MKSGQFCTLAMFLLCVYCLFHFHLLFFLPCLQSQQDDIIVCIIFCFVLSFLFVILFYCLFNCYFSLLCLQSQLAGRQNHCFYKKKYIFLYIVFHLNPPKVYFSKLCVQSQFAGPPVSLLLCAASPSCCQFDGGIEFNL